MSPERRENRSAPINRRILVDIEDTLDNDLNIHDVPFTYSREYGLDPPNPFVQLQDFGAIGLPLSERDAQAFISFSEKDASQPTNLWEFSACDVHFMNPKWGQWVKNTVAKDVRHVLGLPPCECEFGKMSLQSAGSAARPPQDSRQLKASEDRPVFGTIEILLPSSFIGGDVTIAYPAIPYERTTTTEESCFSTFVLGFRAGAVETIAPLQSGYRLSLTYYLVHSGNDSQLQTSFDLAAAKEKLRSILSTWKTDASSPNVIPIKLVHKYTAGSSFSSMSLRHPDDVLLLCLQSITADLHLPMFIVHVEHYRVSFLSIDGDHSDIKDEEDTLRETRGYYRSYDELMRFLELYGDEDEYRVGNVKPNGGYRYGGMVIKQIVDMEGMPVTVHNLDFPAQSIIHDAYDVRYNSFYDDPEMDRTVRGKPDFEDLDVEYNHKDLVTGDYLEVWKDTLLVLCGDPPSWTVTVGDVFDYACDHLELSQSPKAGTNENKLVEALLECCKKPQSLKRPMADKEAKLKRAAMLLVDIASRWNDVGLFDKTVEAYDIRRKIDRIGSQGFVTAYNTFPWMSVKAFFSDAIIQGESNPYRTDVLRTLKQAAEAKADFEVVRWCQEIEETIYFNLKPVDETQVSWLVDLAKERGVSFFRNRFFERFKSDKNLPVRFWLSLSQNLIQSQHAFGPLARETSDALISELTALAVQSLPAFPLKEIVVPPEEKWHVFEIPADSDSDSAEDVYEVAPEYEMDIDLIMDIIGLCVRSNNSKHCAGRNTLLGIFIGVWL
ncbi:uncharacterized protein EV420DRAFT_576475 [Desarmillaria tabescens]|uniref:Uncharacterized protein n=1 Tax=Armillaria tabescens TaxID=1929756 RepID=A0AA39K6M6_ARMTA|nr:uncharacterized protein EV420DRAFT_576475 [Desarmillaria tabescens]KAK0455541.1 hypothetical protein EV420DRAFT_576475 [Desarmillaria tabescens]